MRDPQFPTAHRGATPDPIRFPVEKATQACVLEPPAGRDGLRKALADRLRVAVGTSSRDIRELARQLNCLGFFDDDDDRPRAA